jgi:hypothetical protein
MSDTDEMNGATGNAATAGDSSGDEMDVSPTTTATDEKEGETVDLTGDGGLKKKTVAQGRRISDARARRRS